MGRAGRQEARAELGGRGNPEQDTDYIRWEGAGVQEKQQDIHLTGLLPTETRLCNARYIRITLAGITHYSKIKRKLLRPYLTV